jgi:hypothetical protein
MVRDQFVLKCNLSCLKLPVTLGHKDVWGSGGKAPYNLNWVPVHLYSMVPGFLSHFYDYCMSWMTGVRFLTGQVSSCHTVQAGPGAHSPGFFPRG